MLSDAPRHVAWLVAQWRKRVGNGEPANPDATHGLNVVSKRRHVVQQRSNGQQRGNYLWACVYGISVVVDSLPQVIFGPCGGCFLSIAIAVRQWTKRLEGHLAGNAVRDVGDNCRRLAALANWHACKIPMRGCSPSRLQGWNEEYCQLWTAPGASDACMLGCVSPQQSP